MQEIAEKTLVLLKPEAVRRKLIGRILSRFEDANLTIEKLNLTSFKRETLAELYKEHRGKDFYDNIVSGFAGKTMVALVLAGPEGTIPKVRSLIGATDPLQAAPGSIRGDLACHMQPDNLIHASDSSEAAARELSLFFPDLQD